MSDMFDAYRDVHGTPALPTGRAQPKPEAPAAGEVFSASRRVALVDNSDWQDRLDAEEYGPIVDAINAFDAKQGRKVNFFTPNHRILARDLSGINNPYGAAARVRGERETVEAGIWEEMARIRQIDPGFLSDAPKDRESLWTARYAKEAAKRAKDQATLGRSEGFVSGVAEFGGGMTGALEDPYTIITLPIGGMGKTAAMRIASAAAANAGVEAVLQPTVKRNRGKLGEEVTAGDMARNVGFAAVAGGAFQGVGEAAGFLMKKVLAGTATPDERAALHVLEREGDIEARNPHVDGPEGAMVHRRKMSAAMEALKRPMAAIGNAVRRQPERGLALAPDIVQFFREKGYSEAHARGIAAGIQAESRSDHSIRGGYKGRAVGLGQWLGPRRAELIRRYGETPTRQQQLEFLHEELQGRDPGGRSVLAGADEADVLRRYISDFMRPAKGAETTGDMRRGMAALGRGEEAMPEGVSVSALDSLDADDAASLIRPEALDAVRPVVSVGGRGVSLQAFDPDDIGVDAALMQFKSGGDQFGVTDRLQGVAEWDPIAAGAVTVWEGLDGRRLIADGHQRLGLAKRMRAANPDTPISMNAFVLREADGVSAIDARILTALKNIGEGTGTMADAAKVFRDGNPAMLDAALRRLPPRSALVRGGRELSRLSDDAFGAVINDVIPESYGAIIGRLAEDRDSHGALVDLLAKLQPANQRQAEGVVRQAIDAGFSRETQVELFGARDVTSSLFLHRAKILDRSLNELKKLKGVFQVAARNADALEGAGNRIAVDASAAASEANARALDIVERLAYSKGHVADILNDAAQRIANGEPIARVTADVVKQLRELDLAKLAADGEGRGVDRSGGAADRGGRADGLDDADGIAASGPDELSPSDFDDAVAAGQVNLFDDPQALSKFDDPAGEGMAATVASMDHDLRAMGLHESDALFDLGDGLGPRAGKDIFGDLELDKADIETIRGCL